MSRFTDTIRQLNQARENALKAIAEKEAATLKDNADRSPVIASIRRDLSSFDRQLEEVTKKQEAEEAAAAKAAAAKAAEEAKKKTKN